MQQIHQILINLKIQHKKIASTTLRSKLHKVKSKVHKIMKNNKFLLKTKKIRKINDKYNKRPKNGVYQ